MIKITLFLMSEKGYKTLKCIVDYFGSDVIDFVVVGTDNNIKNDHSKEIKLFSSENGIDVYERRDTYSVKTEYSFAISWRWIISLDDNSKLITLHDSILPKYRGFAPLVNQLINKESFIGVTAIISDDEYDRGDIISQSKTHIDYPMKIGDAITDVSVLYTEIVTDIIKRIVKKEKLKTYAQNEKEASYSLWRNEDDYKIDWNQSATYILNFINAVGQPYKGASSEIIGRKIRIYNAVEEQDVNIVNRDCGKVIFMKEGFPVIVCGTGLLKITQAKYDEDGTSIFPLNKFRLKFS